MKEFDKYITISFKYGGCKHNYKIDKKEIEIHEDNNVWFSYFDLGKYGFCSPFAVNVYIIENDEGVQVAQIDDVDIIECV